ncbi:unnamed protein product [Trifolium pratense]|uniref:Uncharacterized protein n=1 Tax=Trifolium pratense TaxID=57577 RepID=A0ACB0KC09_TRIPR|nr:unnamed protein product [Trifolium pratense]
MYEVFRGKNTPPLLLYGETALDLARSRYSSALVLLRSRSRFDLAAVAILR